MAPPNPLVPATNFGVRHHALKTLTGPFWSTIGPPLVLYPISGEINMAHGGR
jgi:hypothetical protein